MTARIRRIYSAPAGPWGGRFESGTMHEQYLEVEGKDTEDVIRRATAIRDAAESIIAEAQNTGDVRSQDKREG